MLPIKVTFSAPSFLVVTMTIGVFALIVMLFLTEYPKSAEQLIFTLTTLIFAKWGTMVDFHFGSSSGSTRKTEMMGAAQTTETTATPDKVVTVTSPGEPKP